MTQPRLIRPHATYAICRRVEGRRFLLRPDSPLVSGVVWAPGHLSIVELETPQAIVEQIAYAIVNPVEAGLVHRAHEWPGVTASASDIGRRVLHAARPTLYFRGDAWPPEASLRLMVPACLSVDDDQARAWIASEVERQEAEARAYVKDQGWNVLGRLAAMNVSPYRCAKSWQELGKLVPTIAAGRGQTEARTKALAELRAFRVAYRAALERWKAGDREVVFPAGTYWMRVHHGARVESFD